MSDKLIMENYLLVLKSTVEVYVHGTLESSNNGVRTVLKNGLDTIMNSQNNTYQNMVKNNWYQVNNVDSSIIGATIKKINLSN